ncbi:MAG: hypothetical protein EP343_12790 [Deltaproteobacteria bacterium]|nr:MAG: hypothetical protein EP343_12790 [Deltaproteobacteria bacterium]
MSVESQQPKPQETSSSEEAQGTQGATPAATENQQVESDMKRSLVVLQQIEMTALALGLVLAVGAWFVQVPVKARIAVLIGALFSSVNFRLMIWSWSWVFRDPNPQQSAEERTRMAAAPRFLLKYLFLLAGLALLVGGIKLHIVGFMVGLGNVLVAVALSPAMMLKAGR